MAYINKADLKTLYTDSKTEAHIWREDYPSYERLADNGLLEGLDPNLPEVNDGSLAAALFKLPKRIVSSKLSGTIKAIDRDEAWLSELANLQWRNNIIPNANSQAPFSRKWKDAVRKAAIYGSVPVITLFVKRGEYTGSDFIIAQPQDVTLEPGKVSDYDSDVIFWDVYYTKLQLENMIEEAREELKENKDGYNKWNIPALERILATNNQEERSSLDSPKQEQDKQVRAKGFKFCIAVQRGVEAPFYMYHKATDETVREWKNPDPTGDVPIHFLYCYQDFINPYGIGIVKLAGGTQNVLDYMRKADVLATQLGLRPPIAIEGDQDSVDLDSIVYAENAVWFTGNAKVQRQELANGVYTQLPARMSMYKASLSALIPTGDTSTSQGEGGDPIGSRTPAGVKFQAASLSIDDEDFKDNLYITYEAVAKSMVNTHFANMEGTDLMKLSDDERKILTKAGMKFPTGEDGEMTNQLELLWDDVRAQFNFEVDAEIDKTADDAQKLEGLMKVAELKASDPTLEQELAKSGKKLNIGELFGEIIKLTTDNEKIITDSSPEETVDENGQPINPEQSQDPMAQAMPQIQEMVQQMIQEAMQSQEKPTKAMSESIRFTPADLSPAERAQVLAQGGVQADADPTLNDAEQVADINATIQEGQSDMTPEMQANIDGVMQEYGVDEQTAITALAAEAQGLNPDDVIKHLQGLRGGQ